MLTTQEFDRKPVVNFINGTLELETVISENTQKMITALFSCLIRIFRTLCQVDTVREITDNDQAAGDLQFIAGYALFSDCHCKLFVLTGEEQRQDGFTKILEQLSARERDALTWRNQALSGSSAVIVAEYRNQSDLSATEKC